MDIKKIFLLGITCGVISCIIGFSTFLKPPASFPHSDKVYHLLAYCVLTICFSYALLSVASWSMSWRLGITFFGLIALGFSLEVMQWFLAARTFDVVDLVANGLGILLGLVLFSFVHS